MRRLHVPALTVGNIDLSSSQAHHIRDVLRLKTGAVVEAFDDAGNSAQATLSQVTPQVVALTIEAVQSPNAKTCRLTIASAVPKAARADWMIEKLSELGVDRFIPLATARSVALPERQGKLGRWARIATESAKQSRRSGVMKILPLTSVAHLVEHRQPADPIWHLSTEPSACPLVELTENPPHNLTLLIGPEGGWTREEIELFGKAEVPGAQLTATVLRIETAAIAAACVVLARRPHEL